MQTDLPQCTILIIDDEEHNVDLLKLVLNKQYIVHVARNGEEAIRFLQSSCHPDLILLDIVLPDTDGYTLLKTLKDNEEWKEIPVIFLTAKKSEEDETKGLGLGAVDYITKPFRLPVVSARVKTHIQLKKQKDILLNLSLHDGLTNIPNRRYFDERLNSEWLRCMRYQRRITLIIADIDFFKMYNDYYGHPSGDRCLKEVAKTLQSNLSRATDFVARYGGEEFGIILSETMEEETILICERLRTAIEKLQIPHAKSSIASHVTISLGATMIIPQHHDSPSQFVDRADEALYKAKQNGRNQMRYIPYVQQKAT